jgi:hypothetical protein
LRFDGRQLSSQIANAYGRRRVWLATHFYGKSSCFNHRSDVVLPISEIAFASFASAIGLTGEIDVISLAA